MRTSKIKTLILISSIIMSISTIAYGYDTLGVIDDIIVGSYSSILETRLTGRAQQGIAAHGDNFYTSTGGKYTKFGLTFTQEERLFKYHTEWGQDNVDVWRVVNFNPLNYHLGDIDVYNNYVYGVLTGDDLGPIYIAWFHGDTLIYEDHTSVSWLGVQYDDLDDISGLAFRDNLLYLLGYVEDSGTPRIISTQMLGDRPGAPFTIYEIDTQHANGLAFKGDYVFISWGETDNETTAYIDIYEYPLTRRSRNQKGY